MDDSSAPSFLGQLLEGPKNTPLYRLTIYPDRLELRYRTVKTIAAEDVEAVEPWRLPVIGWFTPSGVRIRHRSPEFRERLIFKTFRTGSVFEAFERAGYRVVR